MDLDGALARPALGHADPPRQEPQAVMDVADETQY